MGRVAWKDDLSVESDTKRWHGIISMTIEELLAELARRNALIVHCSRPGKGDEQVDGVFFPQDLRDATDLCSRGSDLSCSVVWPEHTETFGAIGIVLKPRDTSSITLISDADAGTSLNRETGRREGLGSDFSQEAVASTFENPKDYNEWVVRDADTIGLFIHPLRPLEVARVINAATAFAGIDPNELPFDPEELGTPSLIEPVSITFAEVADLFPDLPIYTFRDGRIVQSRVVTGRTLYE